MQVKKDALSHPQVCAVYPRCTPVHPCRVLGLGQLTQMNKLQRLIGFSLFGLPLAVMGCSEAAFPKAGTPELRAELFDTIITRTERRGAFSPVKNERLGFDPIQEMERLHDVVVSANTEQELYYALARLSHARRDRHLDLYLVAGGLELPDSAGLDVLDGESKEPAQAPVRIFPDYSDEDAGYFVGDRAIDPRWPELPAIGDQIMTVNGMSVDAWHDSATAFMRYSTSIALRWKLAEAMALSTAAFPGYLRAEELTLVTRSSSGTESTYSLPFTDPSDLSWTGSGDPNYPGLVLELGTPTYDLLVPEDGRRFVVLVWRGFRETMVPDVDALVAFAESRGLLDHALVMDVTRSRGGSLGAYAMQRLQPLPFKTTFGNLKISDVTEPFIEDKRLDFAARNINDGGVSETIDDGNWLMSWLENDVLSALSRGEPYSSNVPFKLAHAPKESDGILEPAAKHFRGPIGIISGPSGGSHLDQFVSIIVDNGLGPVVGMPPGGHSNTWEWEEVLSFPGTDQPVVAFMWNIGHTIRPNGEIAEGNPAAVDEWIPLTSVNVQTYYSQMLERVLALLEPLHTR